MNWYKLISIAATSSILLPIILILALRLFSIKSFLALLVYYILALTYNLMVGGVLVVSQDTLKTFSLSFNFLETPLILFFILFFTSSWRLSKQIKTAILIYIAFELLVITFFGFNVTATTITIAPGILLNLFYCIYFFYKQTQIHIMEQKDTGKTLMLASLLFAYGSFGLIYLLYYIMKTTHREDIFLVFNVVTIVSSIMMAAGIWLERSKINQPEELNNVKVNEKITLLKMT